MISCSFEINYLVKEDSVIVFYLKNNICSELLPKIKDIMLEYLSKGINNIILNLCECSFIEKDIWDYLIDLKKELNNNCYGDIVLSNLEGNVKLDYDLMELSNTIESFESLNDALYNFGIFTKSA
ncbi:STAS domain-containing protein [Brachyspira pilosicoli]|uniref:STAS domain-containing protein n=1 Tax=Brachyspira pilosicoli TaxID=52584 RepID=UPI00300421E1